jgi:hypothetical protein
VFTEFSRQDATLEARPSFLSDIVLAPCADQVLPFLPLFCPSFARTVLRCSSSLVDVGTD